ncbi:MAG: PAS domain S-box protein [Planctomycetes bacterium]|nr:PAS domain S-box protein [Planctomycetota bacterium]
MAYLSSKARFPWIAAAVVVAAAGGATFCAANLPPLYAGPAAGMLVLASAAVTWLSRSVRPGRRGPVGPAPVSDSPPPGSAARMRRLESAVVHSHDAVAILNAASKGDHGRAVLYVNDAFCRLTGYAREEILGRSLHALRGPDSDPDTLARLRAAMDAGTPLRVELRNYRRDGTPFWVDLSAVPVPDELGRVEHWLLIQRDIDRRKSAERRARQTGQLLRAIIDAFPGPISAKDRDFRYLVMNQFQADLLGITPEAAVGRTTADVTNPEHGARTGERDREVMASCEPVQYESTYPARTGDGRPWLTTKAPLWMPDGIDSEPAGARGVVTVSLDISALKAAEGALRRSEERYRQLFRAIPHPVFVYDVHSLRILSVNEAAVRKYGWTREQFRAMSMTDVRAPDDAPRGFHGSANDSGLPDGPPAGRRHVTRDGAVMDVDVSSFTLNLEGRAVKLALINDVTDRLKAEDELRRSEGLFRGIFESTGAGVSLTDASGLFVSCNPAFAAMIGRSVEEVLRLTPAAITHPDDMPGQLALMDEVRAGRRDRFTYPKRYLRPDGEPVWVELSFSAIRNAEGRYEHGLGVSVNVTERRQLEDQLRQVQKMEAVGQMAGGIAHDFNNILTAVIGNLSLVRLPDYDPNRPLLAAVEQAANRAADLTRKLLGYARRNQLVFAPVEPRDALGEVVALLRPTLDPRLKLTVKVDPTCPPVHADAALLAQALMNLCLNARDAMPDGGELALSAEPVVRGPDDPCPPGWGDLAPGSYVRLTVADTGTGMTDEVLARIYEPFFTTKGIGKGTGLGLPMVQGIVKQHHGWIAIHSRPGAGTRIELNLPTAEVLNTPAVSGNPTPLPMSLPTPTNIPRPPKPPTVLLVDDEPMIRDLGRAVLSRAGFRVLTAEDGADAVEVFARQYTEIDLVILDVTMPRMSGRDAFRHMIELNPSARIMFSTGYTAEDLVEVDGAAGLLSKPYRPQELLAAVRTALAVTPQPI